MRSAVLDRIAVKGARLLPHLAMVTSPDTLLRLVHRLPLPAPCAPRVVGVDDWAIRKGRTHGTIVVDLERRRPVDLLPDRLGTSVAARLRRRPQITVVARDRATEYAWAVTLGAPVPPQVADGWHETPHNAGRPSQRRLDHDEPGSPSRLSPL